VQDFTQPEIEKEIVMKISFGKNIKYKNNQWKNHPFFISFPNFMILHIPKFLLPLKSY
jgi:hypothetical protein